MLSTDLFAQICHVNLYYQQLQSYDIYEQSQQHFSTTAPLGKYSTPFTTYTSRLSHGQQQTHGHKNIAMRIVIGPQNGRVHALGPQGRTCLKDFEAKPYCRELPAPMDQNPAPPAA